MSGREQIAMDRRAYAQPGATITQNKGVQVSLTPGRHHPGALVTLTCATFSKKRTYWSQRQEDAISWYETSAYQAMGLGLFDPTFPPPRNPSLLPSEEVMQDLTSAFCEIFFHGLLQDVLFQWNAPSCSEEGAVGMAFYAYDAERYTIAMHPELCLQTANPGPYMIGILLHELCHTLLNKFCCREHDKTCPYHCAHDEKTLIGPTGHGSAWVRLATHVEAVAKRHIDRSVDLQIEPGICVEFKRSSRMPAERNRCHHESQEMLTRLDLLNQISLSDLKKHIADRETAEYWASDR